MIESLLLQNFQSHKRTELKFDKGVNVIVGATDSGKTAIIRALQWLIWNKPAGTAFRSNWCETSDDTVVYVDSELEKRIDKKGVAYVYGDLELRAFGQNVPVEVERYFNMEEVNMQQQLDSPFLLSESPGKVAAFFNKVAGLDKIDTSLQKIQAQVRATNAIIKYDESFVESKSEELKTFDNLINAETDLIVLENHDKRRTIYTGALKKLQSIISDIETIDLRLDEVGKDIKAEKPVLRLLKQIERKKELSQSITNLIRITNKLKVTIEDLDSCEQITKAEQKVTKLLQLISRRSTISSDFSKFLNVVNTLQLLNKKQLKNAGNLKLLEDTWHKEFPSICPLCGTKIKIK